MAWNSIPIRIVVGDRQSFRQTGVVAGTGALCLFWNWAKRVSCHAIRNRQSFLFHCHRKRSSICLSGFVVAVASNLFSTGISAEQVADSLARCTTAAAVGWQGKDGIAFEAIVPERAIRLCEAAIREDPGEGDAWAFLARAYLKANRHSEALEATEKSVELGSVAGLWQRGVLYAKGEGVEKDLDQAAMWWRKSAEQGYAAAQNNLGVLYAEGEGVEKDLKQAAMWYRESAEQGYAVAQNNLGLLYAKGEGVEKDLEQAAMWYSKSAEQGNVYAQFNLGWFYDRGEGVEKDLKQAAFWYRKAAEQGNADAQIYLDMLLWAEAKRYRKSAEQGYADAQNNLGLLYTRGEGVEKDLEQAAMWWRKSAEQGYAAAQII